MAPWSNHEVVFDPSAAWPPSWGSSVELIILGIVGGITWYHHGGITIYPQNIWENLGKSPSSYGEWMKIGKWSKSLPKIEATDECRMIVDKVDTAPDFSRDFPVMWHEFDIAGESVLAKSRKVTETG